MFSTTLLDALAKDIEQNAGTVIGASIAVSAERGFTGSVTGAQINVSAGAGARGNITGLQISVRADGDTLAEALRVAQEVRDLAAAARSGDVQSSGIQSVLNKAAALGNAVVTAISRGLVEAAIHHYGV